MRPKNDISDILFETIPSWSILSKLKIPRAFRMTRRQDDCNDKGVSKNAKKITKMASLLFNTIKMHFKFTTENRVNSCRNCVL